MVLRRLAVDIMGIDRVVPGVEIEAAVGPAEELTQHFSRDQFVPTQRSKDTVAEEFFEGLDALHGSIGDATLLD